MCGRVYMAPADPELREIIREMNRSKLAERFGKKEGEALCPEGEVFPSSVLPVLATSKAGEERVFPMKWGFTVNGRLLINARAETAPEKKTFQEAWAGHRCAVPVSRYFEWEHDEKKKAGRKYAISAENERLIWLAGLYRIEDGLPVFVILTRQADESIAWMHDRMPVILPKAEVGNWIRPGNNPEDTVKNCLTLVQWRQAI